MKIPNVEGIIAFILVCVLISLCLVGASIIGSYLIFALGG